MSVVTLPRIGIALTKNGEPISAEWYRWAHDATIRLGGVTGPGTADLLEMHEALAAEVSGVSDEAMSAKMAAARVTAQINKPQDVSISPEVLRQLVYRIVSLERRVRAIEETPI